MTSQRISIIAVVLAIIGIAVGGLSFSRLVDTQAQVATLQKSLQL